ncbi:hypothetical protein PMZ80_004817 [Knufia obscura]|uniref:Uncharacterized protein n=1 Tax=Knufia obscura TaxID=1635080 RepID=A0ABR0RNS1_9EURO|nr:hypothetical protein PMZ80_004817 [Knufia obscura]
MSRLIITTRTSIPDMSDLQLPSPAYNTPDIPDLQLPAPYLDISDIPALHLPSPALSALPHLELPPPALPPPTTPSDKVIAPHFHLNYPSRMQRNQINSMSQQPAERASQGFPPLTPATLFDQDLYDDDAHHLHGRPILQAQLVTLLDRIEATEQNRLKIQERALVSLNQGRPTKARGLVNLAAKELVDIDGLQARLDELKERLGCTAGNLDWYSEAMTSRPVQSAQETLTIYASEGGVSTTIANDVDYDLPTESERDPVTDYTPEDLAMFLSESDMALADRLWLDRSSDSSYQCPMADGMGE